VGDGDGGWAFGFTTVIVTNAAPAVAAIETTPASPLEGGGKVYASATLLMRSNMLDVMQEDFVTLARMKGISEWKIMLRHAARNALLPVVTAMAMGIGFTMGGDVVVETIFSWPGLGRMLVRAVSARDYPVAQGAFLTLAAVMVFLNLLADLLYYWLDPRVGRSKEMSV